MEGKMMVSVMDYVCEEENDDEKLPFKGMRKMTSKQEKEFPMVATDSMICQSYYIAACKRCVGCSFAISGCEKVFEMSAG
jgi:hypothetical protein